MAADKVYRILSMYIQMQEGGVVCKEEAAERYDVNQRSIQRDIVDIREFMDKRGLRTGDRNTIVFDRLKGGYRFKKKASDKLNKSEIAAVSKILLDSRAFTKKEMDSLLDRLVECCAESDSKTDVRDLVQNEQSHYIEPFHRTNYINSLWDMSEAVNERKQMEIVYRIEAGGEEIRRKIKPVMLMFNDLHFYLVAYVSSKELFPELDGENVPISYRVDRIERYSVLEQHFAAPYSDRFDTAEFRKRIAFAGGGRFRTVKFKYNGSSIEPVIDHVPTAKILSCEDGVYTFSAEGFGSGLENWLKSQGANVEIL